MKVRDKIEISIKEFGEDKVAVEFIIEEGRFIWMQSVINQTDEEYRKEFEEAMLKQLEKDFARDGK